MSGNDRSIPRRQDKLDLGNGCEAKRKNPMDRGDVGSKQLGQKSTSPKQVVPKDPRKQLTNFKAKSIGPKLSTKGKKASSSNKVFLVLSKNVVVPLKDQTSTGFTPSVSVSKGSFPSFDPNFQFTSSVQPETGDKSDRHGGGDSK